MPFACCALSPHTPAFTSLLFRLCAVTGAVPLLRGVTAFYRSVLENSKRPKLSWTIAEGNGTITATMDTRPTKAVLRQAVTYTEDRSKNGTSRRDFRLLKGNTTNDVCHFVPVKVFGAACLNPVVWIGEDVEVVQKGASEFSVTGALDMPPDGFWRGGLIDFYFPGPAPNMTYRFTTQVRHALLVPSHAVVLLRRTNSRLLSCLCR